MKSDGVENPDFWEERFQAGRTPWDLGGVPSQLKRWLDSRREPGSVLIPGCGSGWEIRAFEQSGWKVTAVDFSRTAVEQARSVSKHPRSQILLGDFFTCNLGAGTFDVVYERTFLCSMPPIRRNAYRERIAQVLGPGGLLIGYFLYGMGKEPPPFPIEDVPSSCFLTQSFELDEDMDSPDALPLFAGRERWQVWKLKG